jgi:putative tryptophan/tyrosine transport system substrate-binding protein
MQFDRLGRRQFITLLGGAAVALPLSAPAQQPALPVIGFLNPSSPDLSKGRVDAFRQGLGQAGYVEGRNVAIEFRWAEEHYDRLPAMAAELVRRPVTAMVVSGLPAALAAKTATATIPIAFIMGGDPVSSGLVASLNRPGGNLTGIVTLSIEIGPKRLEFVHELVPTATSIAALINPTEALAEAESRDLQVAARALGLKLHVLHASADGDFDKAFASLVQLHADALVIENGGLFNYWPERLGALALRYAVPTIFQFRAFAASGGLMSYGDSPTDPYHQLGVYIGRILKGEKPADLPVVQSTKIELIINLKTAKALGITVPLPLLGRADEVIE